MTALQSAPEIPVTRERTNRWRLLTFSALAGIVLAAIWSPRLVDGVIACSIADPVVGGNARDVAITGSFAAAVFAY